MCARPLQQPALGRFEQLECGIVSFFNALIFASLLALHLNHFDPFS